MDKLGIRELLRYGYAGVLCVLVAALLNPDKTSQIVTSLGSVLSPLAALVVGTVTYLVFKAIIGDFFLWDLIHWFHSRRQSPAASRSSPCKVRYLEQEYQVPPRHGAAAYALVRDQLLKEHVRERFHVQHSEGYLLFLTAFVCGVAAPLAQFGIAGSARPLVAVVLAGTAFLAMCAGLLHENALCRAERAAISVLGSDDVKRLLCAAGFISASAPEAGNAKSAA
jgi:hypothetical protein